MAKMIKNHDNHQNTRRQMISIVIPTLNEEKNIKRLLNDIKIQDKSMIDADFEIIIADAGSIDKTIDIALQYGAKIIGGGLPGKARNNGAQVAKGSVIYFMDADISFRHNKFIEDTYNKFIDKRLDCATIPLIPKHHKNTKLAKRHIITGLYAVSNILIELSRLIGFRPLANATCMIVKRKSFLEVHGFNEQIYWGEDSELAERMDRLGYEFDIIRSALVNISPRKVHTQGTAKYFWNAAKLDAYRKRHGEIYTREQYSKIASIKDYFSLKKTL